MANRQYTIEPGTVFGRWTFLRELEHKPYAPRVARCRCVCGAIKEVNIPNMRRGLSQGCGCLRHEVRPTMTHGLSHTREYKVWVGIRKRCTNPATKGYENYGGRGITIAPEWENFERFWADMGRCPKGHTIERINNDGNYEPGNCRWATRAEQAVNTRHVRWLTLNGETHTLTDWARKLGLRSQILTKRLARGWSLENALTLPALSDQTRLTNRYIEFMGERHCVTDWAKLMGLPTGVLQARLHLGWSVERALTFPHKKRRKRRK